MKTRISVLIILLLISVNALACNPPQPTGVPNATPTITVSPAPNGRVLTVEELVSNALAGKYRWGQTLTVYGLMEGYPGLYSVNLGPPYKGLTIYVEARRKNNNGLYPPIQVAMTVRGTYAGHNTSAVSLEDGVLVSE